MRFEVPRDVLPLTEDDKCLIHENVEVYDGFLYYHRTSNPTDASIIYSSNYIAQLLTEKDCTHLILDFTDRELVNHRLRRLMLTHALEIAKQLTFVGIILNGNSFRRVIIDFFIRAYIRRHRCEVQFFETKDVALAKTNLLIQSNQP